MSHVESHCKLPRLRRRDRIGDLWACDCGQVYRLGMIAGYEGYHKTWRKFAKVSFPLPKPGERG